MEELKKQLVERAGIDPRVADRVTAVVQQNADKVPQLLSGDAQAMTGLLESGGLDTGTAEKVTTFLKENAGSIPNWLGGGLLAKGKSALGGLMGGK